MAAAVVRLDRILPEVIAAHGGVRPVEQGEGDSFVVAFARASDAVEFGLALQRAPLAPIRLRIGGAYRRDPTTRRRQLHRSYDQPHGAAARSGPRGQTVLSGASEQLVVDRLPAGVWLADLGVHQLRDLPRPERVVQLCHPDLVNEFPPLREPTLVVSQHLPVHLTNFVGRDAELAQVRELLAENRLVTMTGAGGVGKTRLAIQVAAQLAGEFGDAIWYVDLAPITDAAVVPITAARAFRLPDQPGRSTMDTLTRFVADRQMLVVVDNCEHLLDATAVLVVALLEACPGLTFLATSREPIGVAGEVSWRVPSLSLADEALELFTDRARHARPGFTLSADNAATVGEICARLDGVPLAIELAAARVRTLSLAEILDSLHDRFRLLTDGARTAVRRQQTLRASVDWSHALLTEPKRGVVSPAGPRCSVIRSWISSACWWTNRWSSPTTSGAERATGCSKLCASTRWKNSGSPARPMSCGRVTGITTRRWRRCLMRRRAVIMSSVSSRRTSRSTICAPRSGGVAKTPMWSWRWHWRRRCSRCGSGGAAAGKGWPGLTPSSARRTHSTSMPR
jgi:NB-ARC domain-containing protein